MLRLFFGFSSAFSGSAEEKAVIIPTSGCCGATGRRRESIRSREADSALALVACRDEFPVETPAESASQLPAG